MNDTSDYHGRWLHAIPLVVIAGLAITLWRPAADAPPSPEQEMKIADLAALLGSRTPSAGDIDNRLRSFGPFPPDLKASRALAEALVTCGTAGLDEPERIRLARHVYGITVIGDDRAASVPAALLGIQQTVAATGCGPAAIDEVVRTARDMARIDPKPRRDWW
jgi:hypothetical protein